MRSEGAYRVSSLDRPRTACASSWARANSPAESGQLPYSLGRPSTPFADDVALHLVRSGVDGVGTGEQEAWVEEIWCKGFSELGDPRKESVLLTLGPEGL
jgi:hypothetical protein